MAEYDKDDSMKMRPFVGVEPQCQSCPTQKLAEWHALVGEPLDVLNQSKTCANYRAGQVVFQQHNPCLGLHCVLEGSIAMRRADANGNSSIVRLIEAGQTLGHRAYFAGTAYSTSAQTLTDCRICFIPRVDIDRLLLQSPVLGSRFLLRLSGDLEMSEKARFRITYQRIRTRLCHLILSLRGRHGVVDDAGNIIIEPPLSRQEMAAVIGARAESLSRAIRALQDDGVAEFGRRRIVIHDLDNLLDEIDHQI